MNIAYLELQAGDLRAQQDFYSSVLELPGRLSEGRLEIQAGKTTLVFTQAPAGFDGAYHFAFNIPENQFRAAREWISRRIPLLQDESGRDEFDSESWNSHGLYFKDAAGNVLEFIARHNLQNAVETAFDSRQILHVSEIGLPAEDVLAFADELCKRLDLSVFKQQPNETFTPVGDDDGLLILVVRDRIWIPNSGVPAKLLPVKVRGDTNGRGWEVRGVPYEIIA